MWKLLLWIPVLAFLTLLGVAYGPGLLQAANSWGDGVAVKEIREVVAVGLVLAVFLGVAASYWLVNRFNMQRKRAKWQALGFTRQPKPDAPVPRDGWSDGWDFGDCDFGDSSD